VLKLKFTYPIQQVLGFLSLFLKIKKKTSLNFWLNNLLTPNDLLTYWSIILYFTFSLKIMFQIQKNSENIYDKTKNWHRRIYIINVDNKYPCSCLENSCWQEKNCTWSMMTSLFVNKIICRETVIDQSLISHRSATDQLLINH